MEEYKNLLREVYRKEAKVRKRLPISAPRIPLRKPKRRKGLKIRGLTWLLVSATQLRSINCL